MREYPFRQGSAEWLEARRAVITASCARDVRRSDGLTSQQRLYVNAIRSGASEADAKATAGYQKKPSAEAVELALAGKLPLQFSDAAHSYAKRLARERRGGREPEGFEGLSQRIGHEEEPFAAIEYIARTGAELEEAFFITTDDCKFGLSLDRWVNGRTGAIEIKTMVSSTTLFKAMVDGDISEYRDQCVFALWLLVLPWIDLCLWCPDLQALHVIRIERDEEEIQALEDDVVAFEGLVSQYEAKLCASLKPAETIAPPADTVQAPSSGDEGSARADQSVPVSACGDCNCLLQCGDVAAHERDSAADGMEADQSLHAAAHVPDPAEAHRIETLFVDGGVRVGPRGQR